MHTEGINWQEILLPDTPLIEIFIRGSIVYLSLFCLLRLVLKRQSGALEISDLLVIVLIADAAQNAMAGGYHSVPDGILLVSTLIFWSFALDWLGYHFPFIQKFIHPAPLQLIREGKILIKNMRRELITKDELMSQLREQGIHTIEEVKEAYMEGDGKISITPYKK
jgi:uncharacterized membrane protein YcaP (DUF421 family)